jgi:hypothetical protein
MGERRCNGLALTPKKGASMQSDLNAPPELVCPCGLTFEPLPWYDEDLDEPLCDECAERR